MSKNECLAKPSYGIRKSAFTFNVVSIIGDFVIHHRHDKIRMSQSDEGQYSLIIVYHRLSQP